MQSKTAEFVTPRHPDKLCDRISDAILDEAIRYDATSRVAIETMGGHGIVTVTGEMTTNTYVDIPRIVRSIVCDDPAVRIGVQVNVVQQSPEISEGVDTGGAGDQGIMAGYATDETPEMMPAEYVLARSLCMFLYSLKGWKVDGKTQVTIDTATGAITKIVASFSHIKKADLLGAISEWHGLQKDRTPVGNMCTIFANPAGDWKEAGFDADTGITGRKLMVDNYGPQIAIGGGAYSGKDPTKVDRSGAYMARYIACKYLREQMPPAEEGKRREVFVRLAYAIGYPEPVQQEIMATVSDAQTGSVEHTIKANVWDAYPEIALRPSDIIHVLGLREPIYAQTASWGHYGMPGFTWEPYQA